MAQDLYDSMSTDDVVELIFGGPVSQRTEQDYRVLSIGDYADDCVPRTRLEVAM